MENVEEEREARRAYIAAVGRDALFHLILAAKHLNIEWLLELTLQEAANRIRGRTPEEIRRFFNITVEPMSREEEETFRRENGWAFE